MVSLNDIRFKPCEVIQDDQHYVQFQLKAYANLMVFIFHSIIMAAIFSYFC